MAKQTEEQPAFLNIYQRILAIMKDVSYIQKEDKKVNNQYTFVSHDAVVAKVREFLVKHGVVAVPSVDSSVQTGNTTVVEYSVTFVNVDNPVDQITVKSIGYGVDPQDKGPGKAMSYAYKYALLKVFALETGDDPERDSIPRAATVAPVKMDGELGSYKDPKKDQGIMIYLDLLRKEAEAAKLEGPMTEKVVEKYATMASNMGFAQWKTAVEGAIAKMKG